jgi:hypothetical protein
MATRQKLKDDFVHYAPRCLKIRTKKGKIEPFELNKAQLYIHEQLEKQKRSTGGRVRALVLKGRQQGCSTYIGGRFYHQVTHRTGVRAFILTHEQKATDNLFGMTERYHSHCPELVKPHVGASNAKELSFDILESGYGVGTAGTKEVGRSNTVQLFHGSEVAFWANAKTHAAGIMQAIPYEPGTEIILESTANGQGNFFHQQWQLAESGVSEFIAIFVPWYWQEEYRRDVPEDFVLNEDEQEYMDAFGLDLGQMVWRRAKIVELDNDVALFRQEYPGTSAEAFQFSGTESYIQADLVMSARKCHIESPFGPMLVGVDPARFGNDRSTLIRRRGRKAYKKESYTKIDTMELVGRVANIISNERPDKVFIDVGGLGAGVYDRLLELGYGDIVVAVNFGGKALRPERYLNKRAEMWGEMKAWLAEKPADIPDDDELHADITGPGYRYDSSQRVELEKKEDMKKRGLRSPDGGDALGLTFAMPVAIGEQRAPQTEAERDWANITGQNTDMAVNLDDF